jgi:2,3-bisphosphoglycerate-independent phosphoglycerate mutase
LRTKFLKNAFAEAEIRRSSVHLVGLLSDGDVHSSSETLFALLRLAKYEEVEDIYVHPILDGRDVPPRTADVYVEALEIKLSDIGVGKIATFVRDAITRWTKTNTGNARRRATRCLFTRKASARPIRFGDSQFFSARHF